MPTESMQTYNRYSSIRNWAIKLLVSKSLCTPDSKYTSCWTIFDDYSPIYTLQEMCSLSQGCKSNIRSFCSCSSGLGAFAASFGHKLCV